MREIKFRAWDGEKVRYDVTGFEHEQGNEMGGVFLDGDYYLIKGYGSEASKILHPEAEVMQYTGLIDKNGVEIYEGDILDFDEGEWGGKFTPEVVDMAKITGEWQLCGSLADLCEFRSVIGNIHQNSELLEK